MEEPKPLEFYFEYGYPFIGDTRLILFIPMQAKQIGLVGILHLYADCEGGDVIEISKWRYKN